VPEKRRDAPTQIYASSLSEPTPEETETVTMVPLGEGRYVPQTFGATLSQAGYWADLTIEIRDREAVCTRLSVLRSDGGPIQKEDLRALPLRDWINAAVASQTMSRPMVVDEDPTGYETNPVVKTVVSPQEIASMTAGLQAGKKRITDDDLQEVARVYREAVATGEPPTVAVARHMKRSRSTAGRLVMQARQRGFLGRARARMAGELAPSKTTEAKKRSNQ
jgi:hypothetical protein